MRSRAWITMTSFVLLAAVAAAQGSRPVGGNPSGSDPIPLGNGEGGPSHGANHGGNNQGGSGGPGSDPSGSNPTAPGGVGSSSGDGGDNGSPGGGLSGPTGTPRTPGFGGTGGTSPGARAGAPRGKKASHAARGIDWPWWWAHNQHRYYNLKAALAATAPASVNADLDVGADAWSEDQRRRRLERYRQSIVSMLRPTLRDRSTLVRVNGVLALARCGSPVRARDLERALRDTSSRVREAACLGLGMLGDPAASSLLADIMRDTRAGRRLLETPGGVPTSMRAHAAIALGLLASREGADDSTLGALVEMSDERQSQDVTASAIGALGVARAREAVPFLLRILGDRGRRTEDRAQAAVALGRIGDRSALATLVRMLSDRRTDVRRSACIALGLLADENDARVIRTLRKIVLGAPDRAQRNFAVIAIGEIGGRENQAWLAGLARRGDAYERTFAAIALGLLARKHEAAGDAGVARMIHGRLRRTNRPMEQGAYSIALGLMGYFAAAPDIIEVLSESKIPRLRAEACQALGLLRDRRGIAPLRDVVRGDPEPSVRVAAATALGLIGDRDAVKVLDDLMQTEANIAIHGSAVHGLGLIGDGTMAWSLGRMMHEPKRKTATRAFAAMALGLLADKDEVPVLAKINSHANYLAAKGTMAKLLGKY